ncbi:MAG TPA: prepilin-type N-terminal cleavage/methylation domain-containing protein [Terracidiphilus sp.]|jgi:type IV pilus assembly protein PilA|nr:prepilin-type N-terminal cleavage/methylation domain-containing protein [Terracidiphilus sp.]
MICTTFCEVDGERPRRQATVNGFTLMELLIVMAIIAILMLIAIPTMGNMTRYANETSAQQSVRAINMAQSQFNSTFPSNGFACTLTALGGDSHSGPPTATNAEMLQQDLAGGIKSGYQFTISNCVKNTATGSDRVTGYTVMAQPLTVGKSGNRTFCSDESGQIKFDPAGGTNCTQNLGQ